MAKIYLSPSNQKSNIGVGEYGSEKSRMIQVAEVVARELRRKFEVKMANYDSNLSSRATESNNWDSDIYVAIHSNAGGGKGCEVFAYSTESKGNILAKNCYDEIVAISPNDGRGIKYNELYETRVPYCPAILIEIAFHDNWTDATWIINNIEAIGIAIAKGIYKYFNVAFEDVKPVEPTPSNNVEIDELKETISALENQKAELNSKINTLEKENDFIKEEMTELQKQISENNTYKFKYIATANGKYKITLNKNELLIIK